MSTYRPNLIVVAGPNGSGKTSLTLKVLQHQWINECTYLNPDNVARDLFGDWNSQQAILAAAQYAETERMRCLDAKESLAFESVLSSPEKIEFIKKAKQTGYFIRLFFVGTNHPSINAARVAQRVMEGGHDVPIPKIISRYSKSIANCAAAATFADRTYVYDNSIDGADPKLLFRTRDGEIVKIYNDIPKWAHLIAQTLPHHQSST